MKAAALIAFVTMGLAPVAAAETAPLVLEQTIALGPVQGRIDHLALDAARNLLFVAELGNNSVGVVDLNTAKTIGTITDIAEPQGVVVDPDRAVAYVASGGDGSLYLIDEVDFSVRDTIPLGDDADNLLIDSARDRLIVGYGQALGIIDLATTALVDSVPLPGHPEGIVENGEFAFVNVPDAAAVVTVDLAARQLRAPWPLQHGAANFPIAIDPARGLVLSGLRDPASVLVFDARDGTLKTRIAACGDADNLFVDPQDGRAYLSCGAGYLDILAPEAGSYRLDAEIATRAGARTALLDATGKRLFVAAPARDGKEAAILVYRTAS